MNYVYVLNALNDTDNLVVHTTQEYCFWPGFTELW